MAIGTEISAPAPPALPGPDQRPLAVVLIYDGQCRICAAQVGLIERWFAAGQLAYLSLHDARVGMRYPDLSHEDLMRQMYVVDRRDRRYGGAAAVRYLSRRLTRLWWLAPLLHVPGSMPLWQRVYRLVASRRYRIGRIEHCDDGSCRTHR
jgi:predicted DCC family thiol-disulfide oxidoreductase YuxK